MEAAISNNDGDEAEDFGELPEVSDPRVERIVQLCLQGKDWEEIAAALNTTSRTIWTLRQKHGIEAIVAQINADAMEAARTAYVSSGKKTFQRLVEMLDSTDPEDRRFAVGRMLDFMAKRGDGPKPDQITERSALDDVADADVVELIRTARRLQPGKGNR